MNKEKSLLEFLQVLNKLNNANIKFLKGYELPQIIITSKYDKEIDAIQNLINSFDFIK